MADDPDALARWRAWLNPEPDRVYGSVLPLSNNAEGTDLRVDLPTSVRETGQGIIDLLRGPSTGTVTPEGSMALLSMVAPNAARRPDPSELGVFIGTGSPKFDGKRAAEMFRDSSIPKEEVFRETGVFKSPDGWYRQEVPDTTSRINDVPWQESKFVGDEAAAAGQPHPGRLSTLSEVLAHPELYDAYRGLSDLPVGLYAGLDGPLPILSGARAAYYPPRAVQWGDRNGAIALAASTPEEARSSLLHEIQHLIQRREGFVQGSSPFDAGTIKRGEQLNQERIDALRGGIARWEAAGKKELAESLRQRLARAESPEGLQEAIKNAYLAAGGEAEARAVQTRANLDPTILRNTFPRDSYDLEGSAPSLWDPKTGRSLPGW